MSKETKIPIQCPICGTIFFVKPEELKDKVNCPRCRVPLEIKAIPPIRDLKDAYLLAMICTYQNINKLYDILGRVIEKTLGGK